MELRHVMSFDDLAEWLEDNGDQVWSKAFGESSTGFKLSNVRFCELYRGSTGWTGRLRFFPNHFIDFSTCLEMLSSISINLADERTYISSEQTHKWLVENTRSTLQTHAVCFYMPFSDWTILAVTEKLSAA